jgi:hypothetical protein
MVYGLIKTSGRIASGIASEPVHFRHLVALRELDHLHGINNLFDKNPPFAAERTSVGI